MNETRFYRPSPQPRHKAWILGVCWFCWAASLTHSISELCSDCPDKCPVSQLHNCSICHDPHNAFDEKLKEHHNASKNKVRTQTESLNTGTVSADRYRSSIQHLSIYLFNYLSVLRIYLLIFLPEFRPEGACRVIRDAFTSHMASSHVVQFFTKLIFPRLPAGIRLSRTLLDKDCWL